MPWTTQANMYESTASALDMARSRRGDLVTATTRGRAVALSGSRWNAVRNAARPGYARVMLGKALGRGRAEAERQRREATAWAVARRQNPVEWCKAVDSDLWAETEEFGARLRERAVKLRAETGQRLGGGARFELLYFLTRLRRPETVVETGVAAGFSSAAFLTALERNGSGRLLSSDFPYFRSDEPERYVGILVPEDLRDRWTLHLAGDEKNLPAILEQVAEVDLFHYDSDKTYGGRRRGMDLLTPRLAVGSLVLMDDIQDNTFFRDWVSARGGEYAVFGRGSYCVGAVGL